MGIADALITRIDKLIRDRLDAAITSRLAASDYTAPDNVGIGNIKAKTDLIPAGGPLAAGSYVAPDNAGITTIEAKTNLIPAAGPPSATDYSTDRAAKLDNLDALISSRLAASAYVAGPSATDYSAARALKLDNLDALISSRLASADTRLDRLSLVSPNLLQVWPNKAASVDLPWGGSNWGTPGAYVQVVAAGAITTDFEIRSALVSVPSPGPNEWQIEIAAGAAGAEVVVANLKIRMTGGTTSAYLLGQILPVGRQVAANSRIAARLTSQGSVLLALSLFTRALPL